MLFTNSASPFAESSEFRGWTLREFAQVSSTNLEARSLPSWHAVRADTQTGGYGRTGRAWVSDVGGLWMSAVLPTPGTAARWAILPLAAGWAAVEVLENLGVKNLRLRWPNDVMVGRRKLAGLLLERFSPATAIVGLGLNVSNCPGSADPALAEQAITLREMLDTAPALGELTTQMLGALQKVHGVILAGGFARIATALNTRMPAELQVELTLNGRAEVIRGAFHGIDADGRLHVAQSHGNLQLFEAHEVAHLRELG